MNCTEYFLVLLQYTVATGQLCCVAGRPHGEKSPLRARDSSVNEEPFWRMNSSFSPPPSRPWDFRVSAEVYPHGSHHSPLSSNSRKTSTERLTTQHHSVSDGAFLYPESPQNRSIEPRWTPPITKPNGSKLTPPSRTQVSRFPYKSKKRIPQSSPPRPSSSDETKESSFDVGFADPSEFSSTHFDFPWAKQNCFVCGDLLPRKSPYSSERILRGGDLPTIAVLQCSHVFHADCLEHVTPKGNLCDPPCPICANLVELACSSKSVNLVGASSSKSKFMRNWSFSFQDRNASGSSLGSRLRRHFTLKR